MNLRLSAPTFFTCLLWGFCCHLPAGELTPEEAVSFAQPMVDANRVKGISVGIIHGDKQLTFHLGSAGRGNGTADDDTVYEIGSITKVFTGILLADAALKQDGLLESEAAVSGVQRLPKKDGKPITWVHLSTHRSGLPRLSDNMPDLQGSDPYATYDSKLASEFLTTHRLARAPGTRHEYSNFAVSWLGHLLARRVNLSYQELLKNTVTEALNMEATTIDLSPDQAKRLATPHLSNGSESTPWDFADLPGAGGIRSSLGDMMKFAEANLHPPDGPVAKAIELAWQKHAEADSSGHAMALGWLITDDGETRFHNGQTGGYSSAMFINRKDKAAVVVLANSSIRIEIDVLAERLMRRMAGMQSTSKN